MATTAFKPVNPLESAIHKGKTEDVVAALRSMGPDERTSSAASVRRLHQRIHALGRRDDALEAWWGGSVQYEQRAASMLAMLFWVTRANALRPTASVL